jgi:hypothetical protein
VRAAGGGRKKLTTSDLGLHDALDALVEPTSLGDPMSPLRWTCKSTTRLAQELNLMGHAVSQRTVCDLLAQLNYSLQSVGKTARAPTTLIATRSSTTSPKLSRSSRSSASR